VAGAQTCVSAWKMGKYTGSPISRIVQWFKTMTTNDYIQNVKNNGWQRFENKL